jgi:threonine synthase
LSATHNPLAVFSAIRCEQCSQPYPVEGVPHRCPNCGGVFDFAHLPVYNPSLVSRKETGIWQYRHAFGLPESARTVSLGEGGTPLVPLEYEGQTVWLKLESLNPTGSYKDRGSAVLLGALTAHRVPYAVEDSSGNAGASFAAYAARAGIAARVYVPESASGPKRSQIEAYGAELVEVPGPRSAAAEAVLADARKGAAYASHAYLPFGLAGIATIAYEIWEQLGGAPGTVVAPVGHGGLLLGIMRGFTGLQEGGHIRGVPFCAGVQARACAPVWEAYTGNLHAPGETNEGPTIAEGVRVSRPVRGEAILKVMQNSGGVMLSVEEAEILPAYEWLARSGFHVEPTSALVWAALKQAAANFPPPVVLILSGAGLKYRTSTTK